MSFDHDDDWYRREADAIGREYDDLEQSNGHRRSRTRTPTAKTDSTTTYPTVARAIRLTKASTIRVRPVRWLWDGRLPLGALTLIGGREGIGKSILAYTLGAAITRGELPGSCAGKPRSIIVAATEDSWEYTIVPRLMAAKANLDLVHRVDVVTLEGLDVPLTFPADLPGLEASIRQVNACLFILDPLLSRLDAALDSHKDQSVRLALEPLVALAERTRTTTVGLIHVTKSQSDDPLTLLMASRAFAAVARSVLFVMLDPEQESTRLLGIPKNNLGRTDLPTLTFTINGVIVAETAEGDVWTGGLEWTGESDRSIRDALQTAAQIVGTTRAAVDQAADWLQDYLSSKEGAADSAETKKAGAKAGHPERTLERAMTKLKIVPLSLGFPRRTVWKLPLELQVTTRKTTANSLTPGVS